MFFSSGDDGDETGGVAGATPTPDWPASSPWVTAVGGTSLGVDPGQHPAVRARLGDRHEHLDTATPTWSAPAYLYGGGGGTSRLFAQPSYQAGVVPDAIATTYGGARRCGWCRTSRRSVTRTRACSSGRPRRSRTAPTTTSTASAAPACPRRCTPGCSPWRCRSTASYGLANPALYAARGVATTSPRTTAGRSTPAPSGSDYNNSVDASDGYTYIARWFDWDEPLTIHVRPGYDDVTGVGSPQLVNSIAP